MKISDSVIRRLPRYYRQLGELLLEDIHKISSKELAKKMSLTASQIRQDFNNFGEFGQQGYGYNVDLLRQEIAKILNLHEKKSTILIGAGNLGTTIAAHIDFESLGFHLSAIFDKNEKLTGTLVAGVPITHTDQLKEFCENNAPEAAILCIPKDASTELVKNLTSYGVNSFWNFSAYDLHVDYPQATVENVYLGDSLMALSFKTQQQDSKINHN